MKKLKIISLKVLFYAVSAMICSMLISTISYLVVENNKIGYIPYIIGFLKFFFKFLSISILIATTIGVFIYFVNKIHDKLFD